MRKKAFTLIELLIVIVIISLLLSVIIPSLKKAKETTQGTVCKSNLHQWGVVWMTYSDAYDGRFPHWKGIGAELYYRGSWIQPIRSYMPNERDKLMICPTASQKNPMFIEADGSYYYNAYGGIHYAYSMGQPTAEEQAAGITTREICSYGMNNWCAHTANESGTFIERPALEHWQTFQQVRSCASRVPLMLDAMWRGGAPQNDGGIRISAPEVEGEWSGLDFEICHFTIPRHQGGINSLFVDLHVDDVSMKRLWGLKWHKNYSTNSIPPNAWPKWMDRYN